MASRRREVQRLLSQAKALIDEATKICEEDELDGMSFMDRTFRCYRNDYNGLPRRIHDPGWYTDEYWCSSSAGCEVGMIYDDKETP